jgi:hypothetical protein
MFDSARCASMLLVERGHPGLAALCEARAILDEPRSVRLAIVPNNRSQEPSDDHNKPGEERTSDRASDPRASHKHRRYRREDSAHRRSKGERTEKQLKERCLAAQTPLWVQPPTQLDASSQSDFGFSVALSGSSAVIGANRPGAHGGAGAAYLFTSQGGTWSQQQELVAANGASGDQFAR